MLAEQLQGHVTTPIMPALPFCYGSNTWKPDLVPSPHLPCDCCLLDSATCLIIHREYTRELDGDCLRAILRVYARENHELRERVEALVRDAVAAGGGGGQRLMLTAAEVAP